MISAAGVILWYVYLFIVYLEELEAGWCLTGAYAIRGYLESQALFLLIAPGLGWLIAHCTRWGVPLARGATLAAAASWLTVVGFIEYVI